MERQQQKAQLSCQSRTERIARIHVAVTSAGQPSILVPATPTRWHLFPPSRFSCTRRSRKNLQLVFYLARNHECALNMHTNLHQISCIPPLRRIYNTSCRIRSTRYSAAGLVETPTRIPLVSTRWFLTDLAPGIALDDITDSIRCKSLHRPTDRCMWSVPSQGAENGLCRSPNRRTRMDTLDMHYIIPACPRTHRPNCNRISCTWHPSDPPASSIHTS